MKPRVLFFSASEISLPCLSFLKACTDIDFVGIVTQPGRAKGRGQKFSLNPVAAWSKDQGIPLLEAEKMDNGIYNTLKDWQPDFIFVMAFGHILKKHFLDLPPLGMWNFHTSLLPKLRGASPIQSAILQGETVTGVTLMSMVEKMDACPWIAQGKVAISDTDTTETLSLKLAEKSADLLRDNLTKLLQHHCPSTQQDDVQATYCKKFCKEDGLLEFSNSAQSLACQIRAFHPWPGSYFFKNDERLIVHKAHVVDCNSIDEPGQFYVNLQGTTLEVTTGKGRLSIDVIQKSGGKALPITDFLRGNKALFEHP